MGKAGYRNADLSFSGCNFTTSAKDIIRICPQSKATHGTINPSP